MEEFKCACLGVNMANRKLLKKGTLHYGQTLLARVHCTNMMGNPVKITLLEYDESGAGHNEKNNRNVMDSKTITVNRNGVAEAIFLLSPAHISLRLINMAMAIQTSNTNIIY